MSVLLSEGARKILRYLYRNPRAQDTLEGILHWWLLDLHIEEQEREVVAALEELTREGLVLESQGRDLQRRYRLNRERIEVVTRVLSPDSEEGPGA